MIQPPTNNVLVKIKSVFNRHMSDIIKTSFAESNDSDINPADYVTNVGEVVALPRKITNDIPWMKGFTLDNIRIGDVAIFSYLVVSSVDISDKEQKFKNCFWYKGQEYWIASIEQIFGVIRGKGIQMVNGYCMIEKMKPLSTLILPNSMKNMLNIAEATVTHVSRREEGTWSVLPMDKVYYNPLRVQKYIVGGKEIGIIESKNILGHKIGIS